LKEVSILKELFNSGFENAYELIKHGRYKGIEYIVSSFVGDNLHSVSDKLPLKSWLNVAKNLVITVMELHKHGFIHTDISPSNVCLNQEKVHLIDFELAVKCDEEGNSLKPVGFKGTKGFIAPELAALEGSSKRIAVSTAVDVFSVGQILSWLPLTSNLDVNKEEMLKYVCQGLCDDLSNRLTLETALEMLNKI
jgi:eukaryotic-like serine/threonine-protein kinase